MEVVTTAGSNITPDWLDEATVDDVAKLPPAVLSSLLTSLKADADRHKLRRARLQAGLVSRYIDGAAEPGTVRKTDGGWVIKISTAKDVVWDQEKLRTAAVAFEEQGRDPYEVLKAELSISETVFKTLAPAVQALFGAGRTVKVRSPEWEFLPPKDGDASAPAPVAEAA